MATGPYRNFLILIPCLLGSLLPFGALAADLPDGDPLMADVDVAGEPRDFKLAAIDRENFQVALAAGVLSVEDFETNGVLTASLTYHITEDFFLVGRYGTSSVGESSFERLSGAANLLAEDERAFSFYDFSVGVNLFPGEAFLAGRIAVGTSFYLVGGAGSNDFAGEDRMAINLGMGYRMLANDMFALHVEVRDHLFETEITGAPKDTHNIELTAGFSFFF